MDQALYAINVHECTVVNDTSHGTFYDITDFQLGKAALHIVFYSFLLREDQFVIFAANVQYAGTQRLIDQCVELLQNFVFISSRYARIVPGSKLGYRQKAPDTFKFYQ